MTFRYLCIRSSQSLSESHFYHFDEAFFNISEENVDFLKRAVLPEVATQFRQGQMLPSIQFRCLQRFFSIYTFAPILLRGFGIFYETGFSTDISENCLWLGPFVRETPDPFKLR